MGEEDVELGSGAVEAVGGRAGDGAREGSRVSWDELRGGMESVVGARKPEEPRGLLLLLLVPW